LTEHQSQLDHWVTAQRQRVYLIDQLIMSLASPDLTTTERGMITGTITSLLKGLDIGMNALKGTTQDRRN
jgi:hypothetical protein